MTDTRWQLRRAPAGRAARAPWTLDARRSTLRPEPFGALAYHFGNRRLTFLKTPGCSSGSSGAWPTTRPSRGRARRRRTSPGAAPGYAAALARLANGDMIVAATSPTAPPDAPLPRTRARRPDGDPRDRTLTLVEQFEFGLDAPICLTWELTYACNLPARTA